MNSFLASDFNFATFEMNIISSKPINMSYKHDFSKAILIIILFAFTITGAMSQMAPPDNYQHQTTGQFTDEELKQFVSAAAKVIHLQEEGQIQMLSVIQENDITLERFNEMVIEAQTIGPENINATEEELVAFNNTLIDVQLIQVQLQESMISAIQEEGLQIDKYQDIMQAYEVDPEVKQRVDAYFAELDELN
jgi:PBP1b-binding outer membrane lipoprotein LpoB